MQSLLEEEYGNNDVDEGVVIVLDAKKVLLPKTPDGVFLVNTPEPTLWILEAKRHLTVRHGVVCLEASGPLACLSPPLLSPLTRCHYPPPPPLLPCPPFHRTNTTTPRNNCTGTRKPPR